MLGGSGGLGSLGGRGGMGSAWPLRFLWSVGWGAAWAASADLVPLATALAACVSWWASSALAAAVVVDWRRSGTVGPPGYPLRTSRIMGRARTMELRLLRHESFWPLVGGHRFALALCVASAVWQRPRPPEAAGGRVHGQNGVGLSSRRPPVLV